MTSCRSGYLNDENLNSKASESDTGISESDSINSEATVATIAAVTSATQITAIEPVSSLETSHEPKRGIVVKDGVRYEYREIQNGDLSYSLVGVDESLFIFNEMDRYSHNNEDDLSINELEFPAKWQAELEESGALKGYYNVVYTYGDYFIIFVLTDSDDVNDLPSPVGTSFCIILSDDDFYYLPIYTHLDVWFNISDNIVSAYSFSWSNGLQTIRLTSFSLETGKEEFLYKATYYIAGNEPYDIINPPEVTNTIELQEYMLSISDTWYKCV